MTLFRIIVTAIGKRRLKNRLNSKIREARKQYKLKGVHHMVLTDGIKMRVYSRTELRELIKRRHWPGIKNIRQLEKKAIFRTNT